MLTATAGSDRPARRHTAGWHGESQLGRCSNQNIESAAGRGGESCGVGRQRVGGPSLVDAQRGEGRHARNGIQLYRSAQCSARWIRSDSDGDLIRCRDHQVTLGVFDGHLYRRSDRGPADDVARLHGEGKFRRRACGHIKCTAGGGGQSSGARRQACTSVPSLLMLRVENVATPATAFACAVPLSVPLDGFVPMAIVTWFVAVGTTMPAASSMLTVTAGAMEARRPRLRVER